MTTYRVLLHSHRLHKLYSPVLWIIGYVRDRGYPAPEVLYLVGRKKGISTE